MKASLRRLARAMAEFRASGYRHPVLYWPPCGAPEVDGLGSAYNAMVERIDEQLRELERRDQSRSDLIAGLSHELRTPLASLRGYLETLLLKEASLTAAQRRRCLEIAARQSERLGALLAELLELARLEAHDFRLEAEPVQLAELAHDLVQELGAVGGGEALALQAASPLPAVRADIRLLERALRLLLEEALAQSPAGERVTLALEARRGGVEVQLPGRGGAPPVLVRRILELHQAAMRTEPDLSFTLPIA